MTSTVDFLIQKINSLENELEAEMAKRRAELQFGLERDRVLFEEEIYLASRGQLLVRVQEIDDGQSRVLLIGHNPGIGDLARDLAGSGERASLRRLARFPTAASAVCEFDLERWRDLAPGSGQLVAYATPKDLV